MNCGPLRVPRKPKLLISAASGAADSGTQLTEAIGFKEFGFQMVSATLGATFTGFTATIYGTMDLNALLDNGSPNPNYPTVGANGGAWFELPAATAGSGNDTQTYANPLTTLTQAMYYRGPALVAVRVIVTASAQSGSINVLGWAVD